MISCVRLSAQKNASSPDPGCSVSAKYLKTAFLSVLFARYALQSSTNA